MQLKSRVIVALVALAYCVFVAKSLLGHWVASPSPAMNWLLLAPILACALAALALACMKLQHHGHAPIAASILYYSAFALLSWRSIWMFFSWDGMYLFPAWLLLASTLLPAHPRHLPSA